MKTAGLAVKMGYKNVYAYLEGLPEWLKRGYPVEVKTLYPNPTVPLIQAETLRSLIDRGEDVAVVDIRDDEDRAAGWIPGSRHIDMETLDERTGEIPRNRKVVIVDLHGKQSLTAARYLWMKGLKDLAILEGGFSGGWKKENYPVEK